MDGRSASDGPRRLWLWVWLTSVVLIGTGTGVGNWMYLHYQVAPFPGFEHRYLPVAGTTADGSVRVWMPNGNLLGEVGSYRDELTAYLRLQYISNLPQLVGTTALLRTSEDAAGEPVYHVLVAVPNDVVEGTRRLAELQVDGFVSSFDMISPPQSELRDWLGQTRIFYAAYQRPVHTRLLALPQRKLQSALEQFILFKVDTDRRVRKDLAPEQVVPSEGDSRRFAADLIAVARFYDLPLDMLLGIGAMENNYLHARGDIDHEIWKRHADPGDVVVERSRGRVRVKNYSLGRWQIGLQTLRYVHRLYLDDTRDYSQLPQRLRPSKELDVNHVSPEVLTTYAGLLLRTLLDYFGGDVQKAEGAYNGGRKHPNLQYAEGVAMVSQYAHRVLGAAAGEGNEAVQQEPIEAVRPDESDTLLASSDPPDLPLMAAKPAADAPEPPTRPKPRGTRGRTHRRATAASFPKRLAGRKTHRAH